MKEADGACRRLPTIFQDRENVRPEDLQATGSARAAAGAANWTKVLSEGFIAERASTAGVQLSFYDHAKTGVSITLFRWSWPALALRPYTRPSHIEPCTTVNCWSGFAPRGEAACSQAPPRSCRARRRTVTASHTRPQRPTHALLGAAAIATPVELTVILGQNAPTERIPNLTRRRSRCTY